MGDLTELAERWRADLAGWAIPAHITAAVGESPWVLPRQVFARRADRLTAEPDGPSYSRAQAAQQHFRDLPLPRGKLVQLDDQRCELGRMGGFENDRGPLRVAVSAA